MSLPAAWQGMDWRGGSELHIISLLCGRGALSHLSPLSCLQYGAAGLGCTPSQHLVPGR